MYYLFTWIVVGIISWCLLTRYVDKRLDTNAIVIGLPVAILLGPIATFLFICFKIGDIFVNYQNKLYKDWRR